MTDDNSQDFLEEIIAERSAENPDFPALVEKAVDKRDSQPRQDD